MTVTPAGSRKFTVMLGASSGYLSAFLTNALSFVTVPLSLGYFGHDRYGAWVLIVALSVYFSLAGLGVPSAALVFAGRMSDSDSQRQVMVRGALVVALCSLVTLCGVLLVGKTEAWLLLLGRVPPGVAREMCLAAFYTFAFALAVLPLNTLCYGFVAIQKPYLERVYTTLTMNAYVVALVWTVYSKGDLADLALTRGVLSVAVGLVGSMHFMACCKGREFSLGQLVRSLAEKGNDHEHSVRALLASGRHFLTSGLAVLVIQQTDTLIISHIRGVGAVAPYQVTFRLVTLGFILFTALAPSLLPLYGGAWVRKEHGWIERSANTMLKTSAVLGGLVWVGGAAFAKPIIDMWVGSAAYAGSLAVVALGAYGYTLSISSQLFVLLTSQNRIRSVSAIRWIEAGCNLLLSMLLVSIIGAGGAALGSALAALVTVLWLLPREIDRHTAGRITIQYRPVFLHFCRVIVPCLVAVIAVNALVGSPAIALALNVGVTTFYCFVSLRQFPVADVLQKAFFSRRSAAPGEADCS